MSDLPATKDRVKNNFEKALDEAVDKLRDGVMEVVRKIFPIMVAAELGKLSGEVVGLKRDRIVKLAAKGVRPGEIARLVGSSPTYVSIVLRATRRAA